MGLLVSIETETLKDVKQEQTSHNRLSELEPDFSAILTVNKNLIRVQHIQNGWNSFCAFQSEILLVHPVKC